MRLNYFLSDIEERERFIVQDIVVPSIKFIGISDIRTMKVIINNFFEDQKLWNIIIKFDKSVYSFDLSERKIDEDGTSYSLRVINKALKPEILKRKGDMFEFVVLMDDLFDKLCYKYDVNKYFVHRSNLMKNYIELAFSYIGENPDITGFSKGDDHIFYIENKEYRFIISTDNIMNEFMGKKNPSKKMVEYIKNKVKFEKESVKTTYYLKK